MDGRAPPPAKRLRAEAQEAATVAYPGEEGSLAHIAATRFFKCHPEARLSGVRSFAGVFEAVATGGALYGVVPIENSASGTLRSTYDQLVKHDVVIRGELGVREIYCLCTKTRVELSAIRRVLSHPGILEACSGFLEAQLAREPELDAVPTRSTTEAARAAATAAAGEPLAAAIATREAAVHHGLTVLAEDIGNDSLLETRYIMIGSRRGAAAQQPCPFPHEAVEPIKKHSACFALLNEPGAASNLLSCWALRGLDVLKLETRPLTFGHRAPPGLPADMGSLWDYLFYVEWQEPPGSTEEARKRLWEVFAEFSVWQRDFGAYPSFVTRAAKQPRSWEEMVDLMAK